MNRREAVKKVALLLGGTIIGGELFVQYGCKNITDKSVVFSEKQIAFLDDIAETILPKSDSPGAKDAQVGTFMNVMVRDCYTVEDQKIFKEGMKKIEKSSKEKYGSSFEKINTQQKNELLTELDKEQMAFQKNKKENEPTHYFTMMKQLTILGFFTSELGATKALRYSAVPGKFDPCLPYQKGDKAWAT